MKFKVHDIITIMENKQQISTPLAIVIAGFLIMLGIMVSGRGMAKIEAKTLSEKVGVSKEKLTQCMQNTDIKKLTEDTTTSAENAMKSLPPEERGTPYIVIVGNNGLKAEVRGAQPIEKVREIIDEVKSGKVTSEYKGDLAEVTESDHIMGNKNAPIVIVEYSDLECPYCKKFHKTAKQIVDESSGEVAWVYRHWVVHPTALPKTVAAECVSKIKGNDAFWEYVDLVFGLMKTEEDNYSTENL